MENAIGHMILSTYTMDIYFSYFFRAGHFLRGYLQMLVKVPVNIFYHFLVMDGHTAVGNAENVSKQKQYKIGVKMVTLRCKFSPKIVNT